METDLTTLSSDTSMSGGSVENTVTIVIEPNDGVPTILPVINEVQKYKSK